MGLPTDIAAALAAHGTALGLKSPTGVWTLKKIDPPAIEIEIPDIERIKLDDAESQLGSSDWTYIYTPRLWLHLRDANTSAEKLLALLEQWIDRLDADPTLDELVEDCRFESARRIYNLDPSQPLVGYEATVRVLALV